MTDSDPTDGLRIAERRLQAAQLASDVAELERLVDDDALFAGPDGSLISKDDDLHAHRSGHQVLRRLDEVDLRALVVGSTGVTWLLADLEGEVGGQAFAARLRYTRSWVHRTGSGWRILAAQGSIVAPPE